MRRLRLLAAWLASVVSVTAATSVWKVTRNGHTLYLGGTIHLLRAADLPLPREFDAAFAASAQVVFETDIARLQSPEMQTVLASRGLFTDGRTLDQVLTPKAWQLARDYATKAGLPIDALRELKPWLFVVTLAQLELQKLGVSSEGVDFRFDRLAREQGKKTAGLEPFDQHVNYLVNLGAGHESEMVASAIDDLREMPEAIDKLIAAWKAGDLATIDRYLVEDMRTKYPAIHRDLLLSRNQLWMPQLERMLTTPEIEFVLVGAGHLAGKDGLVAQLKAKGCVVEPMSIPPPKSK